MTQLFNKLHHICIVVHDIDKAQAYYESIGMGPWFPYPPLSEYEDLEVPDKSGFLSLIYRVCNLPNVAVSSPKCNSAVSGWKLRVDGPL
jgi:catechol 2,3-dioxygenase-like lactoylglutathione lyase family enzyme